MTDEEKAKQKSRGKRNTKVTSVSISNEFRDFMDSYDISPTDAIRKGVAIILFERGLPQYKSDLNEKRYAALKDMIKINQMDDISTKIKQLEALLPLLRDIRVAIDNVQ